MFGLSQIFVDYLTNGAILLFDKEDHKYLFLSLSSIIGTSAREVDVSEVDHKAGIKTAFLIGKS